MFGLKKKVAAPAEVEMPFEKEVLAMGPGDEMIVFWKGRPVYMRPATVMDFDRVHKMCEAIRE